MLQWLRNKLGTKREPDPSYTEMLAHMIELQDEWRSFLEQQARVTRRTAKRDRDDSKHAGTLGDPSALPIAVPGPSWRERKQQEKAALRARAQSLGLIPTPKAANE